MRLHFHVPTRFVGGGERHLQYLLKYLRQPHGERDLEIRVTFQHDALARFVEQLGVLHTQVRDAWALAKVVEAFGPDVIQFYTSPLVYEALGLVRHKARVIEVLHNLERFPEDTFSYPKDRTDFLVCVSPHARLFAWAQMQSMPALVIPNGVDDGRFRPDPTKRAARPIIGFAGRLAPDKGIEELIDLAARLPVPVEAVGPDFGGYAGRPLRNLTVHPETASPEDYYQRWWAFLSTSRREAFGMAIAEAMACGCPPVLLDCGGIVPYLRHGREALIAEDISDLARNVRDVVEGRVVLNPLARCFSARAMAERYRDAYRMDLADVMPPRRRSAKATRAPSPPIFRPIHSRPLVEGGALGVTPDGWYGVVRALGGVCDHFAIPEHAIAALDRHRPRLVVLGCYQNDWLPICLHAHRRGARVAATWHASYILNEFHPINRRWMAQLFDAFRAGNIDFLATPHRGLARNWTHFGYPTAWLPNIVGEDLGRQPKLPGLNIGLFGSGQNWKNMECQIAAAAMIPGATVHVHGSNNLEIIGRFGIEVQRHAEAFGNAEYHRLLGSMTVNLCVSQSEVYSYLTAESFLMETPVLAGSITPLVREMTPWHEYLDLCHTPYFDDPIAIRDQLLRLIEVKDEIGPHLREHMLAVNRMYLAQCMKVLAEWQVDAAAVRSPVVV